MTSAEAPNDPPHQGPSRVLVVRHASTAWSRSGRHTGRTDVPLDEGGRAAAIALAPRVAPYADALVLVSPLSRARDTCELAGLGRHALIEENLLEWDYGDYEGRTTPEIRADRPGWTVFGDGCPNGESATDVGVRADRVIARLLESEVELAVLVAHGHLLRVLAARWMELDPAAGSRLVLDAGSLSTLGYEREVRALLSWNA